MRRTLHLIVLSLVLMLPTGGHAQQKEAIVPFRHLTVSLVTGTSGAGLEVATPLNDKFALRAGYEGLSLGHINTNLYNNLASEMSLFDIQDKAIEESVRKEKSKVRISPNLMNGKILADWYLNPKSDFHLTFGFYIGSSTILKQENVTDGGLMFLYEANEKVSEYNRLFGTRYQKVGLKFGDYVLTANEKGNMTSSVKVWAVKPYIGVGVGRAWSTKHRVGITFDFGLMYWGTPKVMLNNERTIKTSNSQEAGITKVLSSINAFPVLSMRIYGRIL